MPPSPWSNSPQRLSLSYEDKMHEAETEYRGSSASIIEIAQTNILQTIAPPVVLINDQGDILYITRQTGKYLEPPVGKANMNIYAMAREGLRADLGAAIRRAKAEKKKVTIEGLRVETNGSGQTINLTVTPFDKPDVMRGLMMVLFEDVSAPTEVAGPASGKSRSTSRQKVIQEELEKELQYTKEHLQTVIEEMETSQEELKSANEELQSTNEELQSTNEEMVTSKEELQSLNEELTTLNAELQSKNEELSETSDDLKNLLNSTQVATLFLDNNLKIKRFTPYVTKIISLIQSDMGRPITDIVSDLQYDDLAKDANEVLKTLVSKETQVQTNGGSWYLIRIVPYRTTENIIDGVVITFSDITDFKMMGVSMIDRAEYAEGIIRTVRESLLVLNGELKIVSANPSFYRTFHVTPEETEGQTLYDLGNGQWNIPALRKLLEELLPKNTQIEGFLMEHEFPIIGKRRMLLNARRIAQEGSRKELILLAIEDITNRKEQYQTADEGAMKKGKTDLNQESDLRRLAEERLLESRSDFAKAGAEESANALALVHELQVHQIELEMQNEELKRARQEAEEALAKYSDLYDFAPIGLFTLDEVGQILESNLAGATFLGVERRNLSKKSFQRFIAPKDRPSFDDFCKTAFETSVKQMCELFLLKKNGPPILCPH